MGDVAIHGSVSATAAYSPEYNYLGDTKKSLDLMQTELILNGTKRFENGIKVAAQLYAYELAGYNDLALDFANIDYSFRQEFGVRVGRNKHSAQGLYNDVQDLDQVRIFASLPLNFYRRSFRPMAANIDGVVFYGNLSAGRVGSFDYQVFGGMMQPIDSGTPFMRGIRASVMELEKTYGASLVWNTPVDGLRVGFSEQIYPEAYAVFGPTKINMRFTNPVASVEYSRGKWIATAEYRQYTRHVETLNRPVPPASSHRTLAYGQLTYQATDRLGVGAYYATTGSFGKTTKDKDTAFAASFALQPWWLVKAEYHFMDGIDNLGVSGDSNPGAKDRTWNYIVLKTTLSF